MSNARWAHLEFVRTVQALEGFQKMLLHGLRDGLKVLIWDYSDRNLGRNTGWNHSRI